MTDAIRRYAAGLSLMAIMVAGCSRPDAGSSGPFSAAISEGSGRGGSSEAPPPPAEAPPPPMRDVPSAETSTEAASAPSTRATVESDRAESPSIVAEGGYERESPIRQSRIREQSGLLTAGDHDDLLNPELYADYARSFLNQGGRQLPFVDTTDRIAVRVTDRAGRPVPFATVRINRPGRTLRLVTAADGVASYYPQYDGVPRNTMIAVSSSAGGVTRSISPTRGSGRIALTVPGTAPRIQAMDLAIVIDTTGSMGDEIAYLQAELDSIVSRLRRDAGNIDLRIGIVTYRDEGDQYVVRKYPLTPNMASVRQDLAEQDAAGGGDTPEAMDQAMEAASSMQWRGDAAKVVLLVADAPPHESGIPRTLATAQSMRERGIHIVPVAASGVERNAEYVMRTMAAMTQSRYVFLTDDSGVGNAHAEPSVDCYQVVRLDQLVARVLAGLVQGRRIEATGNEVIRTVGTYDRGRCLTRGYAPGQGQ